MNERIVLALSIAGAASSAIGVVTEWVSARREAWIKSRRDMVKVTFSHGDGEARTLELTGIQSDEVEALLRAYLKGVEITVPRKSEKHSPSET